MPKSVQYNEIIMLYIHTLDPRLATPSLNWVKSEPSEVLAIYQHQNCTQKKLVVDLSSVQACVVTAVGISICGHYSVCVCVCKLVYGPPFGVRPK